MGLKLADTGSGSDLARESRNFELKMLLRSQVAKVNEYTIALPALFSSCK